MIGMIRNQCALYAEAYRSCACDRIAQVKPGLKGCTVCRNELGIGSPEGAGIYLAQLEQMLSVTLACGSG